MSSPEAALESSTWQPQLATMWSLSFPLNKTGVADEGRAGSVTCEFSLNSEDSVI